MPAYRGAADIIRCDAIHAIDTLRFLCGGNVVSVAGDVRRLWRGAAPGGTRVPGVRHVARGGSGQTEPRHLDASYVTEDLIDVLIYKGAILLTDLPKAAQHKLAARRGMRDRMDALGFGLDSAFHVERIQRGQSSPKPDHEERCPPRQRTARPGSPASRALS